MTSLEKETLASVLAFLRSRGLKETEEILRKEAGEEFTQLGDDIDFTPDTNGSTSSEDPVENETTILNINKVCCQFYSTSISISFKCLID